MTGQLQVTMTQARRLH